jgi:hypothetical protein
MDTVDSNATALPPIWVRHKTLATVWCAIRIVEDSSCQVYDGGRFAIADMEQFEIAFAPAPDKCCSACIRSIEAHRIADGLIELAANAQIKPLFDVEMVDELFEDGGEG